MYAVIVSGGKQYRVAVGDIIRVEKLDIAAGETVELDRVLMISDDKEVRVGTPLVPEKVEAKVKSHGRGDKLYIFKMRRRKNFRRRTGHRQDYTELEITRIAGSDKKAQPRSAKAEQTSDRNVS